MGSGKDKPKSPAVEIPDEAARIMQRMVKMPPKQHEDMKMGGRQAKPSLERAKAARRLKPRKDKDAAP